METKLDSQLLLAGLRCNSPSLRFLSWQRFVIGMLTDPRNAILKYSEIPFHQRAADDTPLYSKEDMFDAFTLVIRRDNIGTPELSSFFIDLAANEKDPKIAVLTLLKIIARLQEKHSGYAIEQLKEKLTPENSGYALEILQTAKEMYDNQRGPLVLIHLALQQLPSSFHNYEKILTALRQIAPLANEDDSLRQFVLFILANRNLEFTLKEISTIDKLTQNIISKQPLYESEKIINAFIAELLERGHHVEISELLRNRNSLFNQRSAINTVISAFSNNALSPEIADAFLDYLTKKNFAQIPSEEIFKLSQIEISSSLHENRKFKDKICRWLYNEIHHTEKSSDISKAVDLVIPLLPGAQAEIFFDFFETAMHLYRRSDAKDKETGLKLIKTFLASSSNIRSIVTWVMENEKYVLRGNIWEILNLFNLNLPSFPSHLIIKFLNWSVYDVYSTSDQRNITDFALQITLKSGGDGFNFNSKEEEILGDALCFGYHQDFIPEMYQNHKLVSKLIKNAEGRYAEYKLLKQLLY